MPIVITSRDVFLESGFRSRLLRADFSKLELVGAVVIIVGAIYTIMLAKTQSLQFVLETHVEEHGALAVHLSHSESMWQTAEDPRHDESVTC